MAHLKNYSEFPEQKSWVNITTLFLTLQILYGVEPFISKSLGK